MSIRAVKTPEEKAKEVVLYKIEQLMAFWSITPKELEREFRRNPLPAAPSAKVAVKYRHPLTGQTWDGIGSQPDWLKTALLKEGFRPQELRVD